MKLVAIPSKEALIAESVGIVLLFVFGNLNPAKRVTFVLQDIFKDVLAEIATIVGKSEMAIRQLESRAHRRVYGGSPTLNPDLACQHELVGAFLAAAYEGDFDMLIATLYPDVVL